MKSQTQITVEKVRHSPPPGKWIVSEIDDGYLVRCGDAVLVTVNGGKPRVFKKLDTLVKKLREEIGVTEFEVVALKEMAA